MVKKNPSGMDYVSIDGYINRLLDVLGLDYDFTIQQSTVELLPAEMKTSSGKRQYLATVTGNLTLHGTPPAANQVPSGGTRGTTRAGTGADVSFDPDKAVKTAQAEALKKAAHQFGIALELWDADHRKSLEKARKLTTPAAMKQEVFKIARDRTGKDKPTAKEIGAVFGVNPGDLAEEATLRAILEAEGLL